MASSVTPPRPCPAPTASSHPQSLSLSVLPLSFVCLEHTHTSSSHFRDCIFLGSTAPSLCCPRATQRHHALCGKVYEHLLRILLAMPTISSGIVFIFCGMLYLCVHSYSVLPNDDEQWERFYFLVACCPAYRCMVVLLVHSAIKRRRRAISMSSSFVAYCIVAYICLYRSTARTKCHIL